MISWKWRYPLLPNLFSRCFSAHLCPPAAQAFAGQCGQFYSSLLQHQWLHCDQRLQLVLWKCLDADLEKNSWGLAQCYQCTVIFFTNPHFDPHLMSLVLADSLSQWLFLWKHCGNVGNLPIWSSTFSKFQIKLLKKIIIGEEIILSLWFKTRNLSVIFAQQRG